MVMGQVVFAFGQWAILALIARVGGAESAGTYALATAIAGPIILFSGLQLRLIQEADARQRFSFHQILTLGTLSSGLGLVAVAAVAFIAYPGEEAGATIIAMGGVKAVENLSHFYYGRALRFKRADLISQSLMWRSGLAFGAFAAAYLVTQDIPASLTSVAVAWLGFWALFDRRMARLHSPDMPRPDDLKETKESRGYTALRALIMAGVPLAISITLGSINSYVPRYFVEGFLGTATLGIFAALAYFAFPGRLVMNAISRTAGPRIADMFANGDAAGIRRLVLQMIGFGIVIGVALVVLVLVAGEPLLWLLYGPEFAKHADLFPWIMSVAIVSHMVAPLGHALTAMQIIRIQPFVVALTVLVNGCLCFLLVPHLGMQGVVVSWIAGLACQVTIYGFVLFRRLSAIKFTEIKACDETGA